jgi:hypothetical protein
VRRARGSIAGSLSIEPFARSRWRVRRTRRVSCYVFSINRLRQKGPVWRRATRGRRNKLHSLAQADRARSDRSDALLVFEGLTGLPAPMHISCPEHLTGSVRRASGCVLTPQGLPIGVPIFGSHWAIFGDQSRHRNSRSPLKRGSEGKGRPILSQLSSKLLWVLRSDRSRCQVRHASHCNRHSHGAQCLRARICAGADTRSAPIRS